MFTIQDFIDKIKKDKIDKSLPMAAVGHFGEIYHLDKYCFAIYDGYEKITLPNGRWQEKPKKVLNIITPDIGPEPD